MMNLSVLRNALKVAVVEIDKSTKLTHIKMGAHKVDSLFYSDVRLDLHIGDYITFEGENFYLNNIPRVKEISTNRYEYAAAFEGERYSLYNRKLRHLGRSEFSYHGTAEAHLQLLVDNINEISENWAIGEVLETETKTITYTSAYCREALNTIANEFDLEYNFTNRIIHLKDTIAVPKDVIFKYGRRKGLYSLTQRPVDATNVITRWYGFGSENNITNDYRDGLNRLTFEERFIDVDVDLYGIREGDYIDEEIFPSRTGTVSGIHPTKVTKFSDDSLNFNINDHLISGVTAKIVFKTGALAGSEFEITTYNNSTKEITFIADVDQFDNETPNDVRKPSIGDSYTLVGIDMPEIYVIEAEAKLKQKTIDYANNNRLAVVYDLEIDPRFILRNRITLTIGDQVTVQSENLQINETIEVNQITKPLVAPEEVNVVLSNTTIITEADRQLEVINEAPRRLNEVERTAIELSRHEALRSNRMRSILTYQGDFNAETNYINNNNRTDVVKYEDKFWFYQGVNNISQSWDERNWAEFEGSFESVATNTLLAERASIADWTIQNGRITSQTEQEGIPNMILNGNDGIIKMSGLSLEGFRQKSELRDEGSFLESAGMELLEYDALAGQRITTSNSSIVRRSLGNVTGGPSATVQQNILAAYYGKAINIEGDNPAASYGGYFDDLRADGLSLGTGFNNSQDYTIGSENGKIESLYMINETQSLPVVVRFPFTFSGILQRGKLVCIVSLNDNTVTIKSEPIRGVNDDIVLQRYESAIFVYSPLGWVRISGLNSLEVDRISNDVYSRRRSEEQQASDGAFD